MYTIHILFILCILFILSVLNISLRYEIKSDGKNSRYSFYVDNRNAQPRVASSKNNKIEAFTEFFKA